MTRDSDLTQQTQVVVIGGGLAGLNAARRLLKAGIDTLVLEARDRLGGRVLTVSRDGIPSNDGFDLGPSWFWPERQPAIAGLVRELGLESFPQFADGDVIFERMSRETPHRLSGLRQDMQSQRIVGGAWQMITALADRLPSNAVRLNTRVTGLNVSNDHVEMELQTAGEQASRILADQVVAALPPRLLARNVEFAPAISEDIRMLWQSTPTWMAPHAKFFAVYERAFWREAGCSGTVQSFVGPMPEVHDATTASGHAALMGFVGIGAAQRAKMGEATLSSACLEQLIRVFGEEAATPTMTLVKDWAADIETSTTDDQIASGHPHYPDQGWITGAWQPYLTLAGSETSPTEAGFLSGAVEASERAVKQVISRLP